MLRDERVSQVYHLAWVVEQTHRPDEEHDVNVKGTENVLSGVLACGANQFIYVSDAMAYGAYADNPPALTETDPLRGNPDFQYACDKAFVEGIVASFARAHPSVIVSVLRPAIIVGPEFDNYLTRLLGMPAFPIIPQLFFGMPFPLPTRYRIYFGEPLYFDGDPDDDDAVVAGKVTEVQRAIQAMLERGLKERKSIFW